MRKTARPDPRPSALLRWYDRERRKLPWRAPPGIRPEPYRVWLSEVMLQQTTAATVGPYFQAFVGRWPSLDALSKAPLEEVLHAWQGLGYYARARNLVRCAREVSERLGGRFPEDEAELRALPGIGPYTAAAIAAIAFERRAVVVDGNVERVMARLFGVAEPLPAAKPRLKELAARLTPAERAGDYAQAVMELGATICLPRQPDCDACPWGAACVARARGNPESLPRRAPKAARPRRHGVAFVALKRAAPEEHELLVRRRPERGLLGGMTEVPSTPWRARAWRPAEARALAPLAADWRLVEGSVRHTFTHFHLELMVMTGWVAEAEAAPSDGARWHPLGRLDALALPTLMKKVIRHARDASLEGISGASIG